MSSNMISRVSLLSILALGLAVSTTGAQAQTAKAKTLKKKVVTQPADDSSLVKASGADEEKSSSSGESLKFNTDAAPPVKDHRPTMQFKDAGDSPVGTPRPEYADVTPEEAPFKTYVGYPKNQVGLFIMPQNLSSSWSYNGQTFNYSDTPLAYGVNYKLLVSPIWNMELEYQHYSMSLAAASVTGAKIDASTQGYDTYFAKGHYCFVSRATFYRQICPGLDIGNDAYPILNFVTGTHLALSAVKDFVVGVNVSYQEPISEKFMFNALVGYNYGTGIGNSGALTSKNNSSIVAKAGTDYNFSEKNTAQAQVVYVNRDAKLTGKVGTNEFNWETKSSTLGFRLGYLRTF